MTYFLKETAAEEVVKRLTAKTDLLDIMIDIEAYLDNSNLYVYDNWCDGELVDGPHVRRYWIDVVFKYPLKQMPDPQGGLRLTPHGTKIGYRKAYELIDQPIESPDDYEPGTKKPKFKKEPVWLVHMKIPRRFIETLAQDVLDTYSDEITGSEEESGNNNSSPQPSMDMGGMPQ